jgi:hypothetical protein
MGIFLGTGGDGDRGGIRRLTANETVRSFSPEWTHILSGKFTTDSSEGVPPFGLVWCLTSSGANERLRESRSPADGESCHVNPLTYSPRLVKALPPLDVCGRALKAYAMYAEPERSATLPAPEWLQHQAASVLREPPHEGDHPAGFLILHYGVDGDYLLVSQWYDANMLKHWVRGSVADAGGNTTFAPLAQHDLIACVWELEVIKFERDAWVNTVLAHGKLDRTSLDAYLTTTFSGWV